MEVAPEFFTGDATQYFSRYYTSRPTGPSESARHLRLPREGIVHVIHHAIIYIFPLQLINNALRMSDVPRDNLCYRNCQVMNFPSPALSSPLPADSHCPTISNLLLSSNYLWSVCYMFGFIHSLFQWLII